MKGYKMSELIQVILVVFIFCGLPVGLLLWSDLSRNKDWVIKKVDPTYKNSDGTYK